MSNTLTLCIYANQKWDRALSVCIQHLGDSTAAQDAADGKHGGAPALQHNPWLPGYSSVRFMVASLYVSFLPNNSTQWVSMRSAGPAAGSTCTRPRPYQGSSLTWMVCCAPVKTSAEGKPTAFLTSFTEFYSYKWSTAAVYHIVAPLTALPSACLQHAPMRLVGLFPVLRLAAQVPPQITTEAPWALSSCMLTQ